MEKVNLAERKAFMNGEKLVAIISEAASSGISLQADRRVPNTRVRVHITLELPWSADQCIQQCGRTHRSNQLHGPEYCLVMTAAGGERRFASMLCKRLQNMGALTKGDRRAADASDLSNFDVDTSYGRKAMRTVLELTESPDFYSQTPPPKHVRETLGLALNADLQRKWREYLEIGQDALIECGVTDGRDMDKVTVKTFLNRLLGLPIRTQNLLFSHFAAELDEQIKKAKEEDKFDEGVVDLHGESLSVAAGYPHALANDPSSGVELWLHRIDVDRGISYERALEMVDAKKAANPDGALGKAEGFYRSEKSILGREKEGLHGHMILLQRPVKAFALNPVPIFKVVRPSTGLGKDTSLKDVAYLYKKVEDHELLRKTWTRLYDDARTVCSHGPNCKEKREKGDCKVGLRIQSKFVLSGAVLPFWEQMQQAVGYVYQQASDRAQVRKISRMRIVRVRCNDQDGKEVRIVGIQIEQETHITKLKAALARGSADPAGAAAASSAQPDVKPDIKPDVKPNLGGAAPAPKVVYRSGAPPHQNKGALVTIQDLVTKPEYNLCGGYICDYDAKTKRYSVAVMTGIHVGKVLALKARNLHPRSM